MSLAEFGEQRSLLGLKRHKAFGRVGQWMGLARSQLRELAVDGDESALDVSTGHGRHLEAHTDSVHEAGCLHAPGRSAARYLVATAPSSRSARYSGHHTTRLPSWNCVTSHGASDATTPNFTG